MWGDDMLYKLLVAEDDSVIRSVVCHAFSQAGYKVYEAEDGEEALALFEENAIDLIILDVMMPKIDGWSVCRSIRQTSEVAIIMLTSRDDSSDQLLGYELGVDEYVTKPINIEILLAKCNRLLKRVKGDAITNKVIVDQVGIEINKEAYTVKVDGEFVNLSPKEYELLVYLIENRGIVLTREKILDVVWGYDYYGDYRVVDTHIKKIRKKIGSKAKYIVTVVRVGYKFDIKELE
jgi:DNA-binding response OmpR family regulator